MKKLFLVFIFLSAFVSCGGGTKETNKCEGVTCSDWQQCNASSGVCEAKSGRCETVQDCLGTNICDANHNCINPDNPCENQTCSAHGTCVVENNSAKCNCETGFVADGLSCVEKTCTTGETKSISCGEDGETQKQVCENGIWKNDGTCLCVNTSTRRTTCQGDGLQYQTCVNGSWNNTGECIETNCTTAGETRVVACGLNANGTQNQVCVNSKWTNTGTCADPDDCGNGTTQLVSNSTCANQSLNGRGQAEQICANGQWIDYEGNCKDPDICVDNMIKFQETLFCFEGQWKSYEFPEIIQKWGTTSRDDGYSVAVDNLGNIFVTGSTSGVFDGNTNAGGWDIFLTKFDNAGNKQWTKQWGTTESDDGMSVAVDSSGNVFVTGYTRGGLDGNTNTNGGGGDIFLTKFDNAGNKLFTKQWGTTSRDDGNSVVVDSSGNVFVTGYTEGVFDGNTNGGGGDIFLTKFDNEGNKLFTKQWGTTSRDEGFSIAVDSSGNVFVTGLTKGGLDGNNCIEGDGWCNNDIFLTKFDNAGNKLFTKQWGTTSDDYGHSVAVDNSGNVFVTGNTYGDLDGNTNAGYNIGYNLEDIFLTKFDNAGTKQWTKQWGTTSRDYGNSVAVDTSGNIFVTGYAGNNLNNSESLGAFLIKLNNNGLELWTEQFVIGGTSLAINNLENIFIVGSTTQDLNGGIEDNQDVVLIKCSAE